MPINVSLSQGVLSNLLALQNTTNTINTVQNQLATGKKVNTALDNPTNFFLAANFQNNITTLNSILDSISTGQRTIDAANTGISDLTTLINSAQGTLQQALASASTSAVLTGTVTSVGTTAFTTSTQLGSIGFAASDAITISDGTGNTITFSVTATTNTIQTLLTAVDASANLSKVKAELSGDGRILLESAGGTNSITISTNSAANGVALANLGFNANTNNNGGVLNNVAASGTSNSTRQTLASQFDALRSQIDQLAIDSSYNGTGLLNSQSLTVNTNATGTSKIILTGSTDTSSGLGLTSTFSANTFQDNYEINAAITQTKAALTSLQNQASTYASQVSVIQARQDFTSNQINTLTNGINDLTLADSNKVGAQLLALQTRQTLSSTALSLATQSDQNVLRLFR